MDRKPAQVNTMAVLILINGIINIIWGSFLALVIVVFTFFVGLICAPILILPMVFGLVEIVYAINLLSDPPRLKKPSLAIAILELLGIFYGNLFGVIVGIMSLVFINEMEVQSYFAVFESPSS